MQASATKSGLTSQTARNGGAASGSAHAWWPMAVTGLVAGVLAGVLLGKSNLSHAAPYAVMQWSVTWWSIGIGLFYRRFRPQSPVGRLLVAYGLINALVGLQGVANPWLALIGVVAEVPGTILPFALVLLYRRRALNTAGKFILLSWTAVTVASYAEWILIFPIVPTGSFLGGCFTGCPTNPLYVHWLAVAVSSSNSTVDALFRFVVFGMLLAVVALHAPALRRSSEERIVTLPVLGVFSVWILASTVHGINELTGRNSEIVFWILFYGRSVFPISFLCGFLAAETYGSIRLAAITRSLASQPTQPSGSSRPSWHGADPDPRMIAEIARQTGLDQRPEWLEAAAGALSMAQENRLLLEHRGTILRNLHDGVQQQLLAAEMRLQLLTDLETDTQIREGMHEVRREVDDALSSLRRMAHGRPPRILSTGGLGPALQEAIRSVTFRVELRTSGVARLSFPVEEAIYFCCLEAMQNVEKHAGRDVRVTMEVEVSANTARFRVVDTGQGFDDNGPAHGHGISNMEERMKELGGWLHVESAVGKGTTVAGCAPLRQDESPSHPS